MGRFLQLLLSFWVHVKLSGQMVIFKNGLTHLVTNLDIILLSHVYHIMIKSHE